MSRIVRIVSGSTLVMAGTAMLVLPGPGLLTIAAGISILAKDMRWAENLKHRVGLRLRRANPRGE